MSINDYCFTYSTSTRLLPIDEFTCNHQWIPTKVNLTTGKIETVICSQCGKRQEVEEMTKKFMINKLKGE